MIWRALVAVAGLAVVAAATHVNVMHRGGYGAIDSWLVIAVSVLLAVGMGYSAKEWRDGSKLGAILLAVCLLAGEAYWLLLNTERELQAREDIERPFLEARAKSAAAKKRVEDAAREKTKADDAALTQAALPGCKSNCAKLLTDAKQAAETELREARAALAALPADKSAATLADNLGVSRWAWDLFMATLRGLAIIGGSIAVGLALHPRRKGEVFAPVARQSQPETGLANLRDGGLSKIAEVEEIKTAPPKRPSPLRRRGHALGSSPLAITARPVNEREHVSHFLRIALRPDPAATASLRRLHENYPVWCREQSIDPLPPAQLGQHLRSIVDAIGLECEQTEKDVIIRGAALN
jgi:hypothetical protein